MVNNAGIGAITEIEWCPIDLYKTAFEINTVGPIRVTKKFLPLLRSNKESRVVFTVSIAGEVNSFSVKVMQLSIFQLTFFNSINHGITQCPPPLNTPLGPENL